MKKIVFVIGICISTLVVSCKKDTTFLITNDSVGKLHKTDLVKDLETIFEKDSVVSDSFEENKELRSLRIKIYEKNGPLLLTLTPNKDSVQTVENIRIEDPRYLSDKGVGLNNTFKDIKDNYDIAKIITSMNNIVITVRKSNLYFTIAKTELPANLRFSMDAIEEVQIPDEAKIKYMMVAWE